MTRRLGFILLTLCWLPTAPAMALGPIDGEVSLNWWANDFDADIGGGDIDAGALGGSAQLWWNETWGVKGALYRSDLADAGGDDDIDYLSLDLQRRLISVSEHNFLAAGIGYEHLDLRDGTDTRSARLLLEARVGLMGAVYAYGHTAWMPVFEDTDTREDMDALEFEMGVGFSPVPPLVLRAGWRQFNLDFEDAASGNNREDNAGGLVFGAGLKW